MKKTLLNTLFLLIVSASLMGQQTSRLIPIQANPLQTGVIPNLLGWRYEIGDYRIYAYDKSGLKIGDTVRAVGDARYYSASNPAGFISNELDPIWNAQKIGYSTTSVANTLYKPMSYVPSWSDVTGKPTLFSGNYNDLSNKPIIPTNNNQLTNGSGFITSVPAQSWSSITGKPMFKKQETFSVTTITGGSFTGTFSVAYAVAPNIQANIVGGTPNQFITMSVTTTGFTVSVFQRNTVNLLSTELLLGTTIPVVGAKVDVLINEK